MVSPPRLSRAEAMAFAAPSAKARSVHSNLRPGACDLQLVDGLNQCMPRRAARAHTTSRCSFALAAWRADSAAPRNPWSSILGVIAFLFVIAAACRLLRKRIGAAQRSQSHA